jgi:hypothetical protein
VCARAPPPNTKNNDPLPPSLPQTRTPTPTCIHTTTTQKNRRAGGALGPRPHNRLQPLRGRGRRRRPTSTCPPSTAPTTPAPGPFLLLLLFFSLLLLLHADKNRNSSRSSHAPVARGAATADRGDSRPPLPSGVCRPLLPRPTYVAAVPACLPACLVCMRAVASEAASLSFFPRFVRRLGLNLYIYIHIIYAICCAMVVHRDTHAQASWRQRGGSDSRRPRPRQDLGSQKRRWKGAPTPFRTYRKGKCVHIYVCVYEFVCVYVCVRVCVHQSISPVREPTGPSTHPPNPSIHPPTLLMPPYQLLPRLV